MSYKKFKIYTKLTLVVVFILAVLIFIFSNREGVTVKFLWMETPQIPKYIFIVIVAVLGGFMSWTIRYIRKTLAEVNMLRREKKALRDMADKVKNDVMDTDVD